MDRLRRSRTRYGRLTWSQLDPTFATHAPLTACGSATHTTSSSHAARTHHNGGTERTTRSVNPAPLSGVILIEADIFSGRAAHAHAQARREKTDKLILQAYFTLRASCPASQTKSMDAASLLELTSKRTQHVRWLWSRRPAPHRTTLNLKTFGEEQLILHFFTSQLGTLGPNSLMNLLAQWRCRRCSSSFAGMQRVQHCESGFTFGIF